MRLCSASSVQRTASGINCVVYGKSLLEKIRSSCKIFSASTNPSVKSSAYRWYSASVRFKTSFFLQLTVPPFLYEDSNVQAVRKSVAEVTERISSLKYLFFLSSQSLRSSKLSIAKIAVTNSKTVSDTPPVFTFSKTWQTASLGVSLSNVITGIVYCPKGTITLDRKSIYNFAAFGSYWWYCI